MEIWDLVYSLVAPATISAVVLVFLLGGRG